MTARPEPASTVTTTPDRVRALVTASEKAPASEDGALWLEQDGGVWADYPTVPADDHMLPMVWADDPPTSRRELEGRGYVFTHVADCLTELLSSYRVAQADTSATHASVWLDFEGEVWADYPTANPPEDLALRLVWASEETDSRRDLEDNGYVFTRIGWNC